MAWAPVVPDKSALRLLKSGSAPAPALPPPPAAQYLEASYGGIDATTAIIILVGSLAAASIVLITALLYCADKRRKDRRKLNGPGGPAPWVVRRPHQDFTNTSHFRRAEGLVPMQFARVRANERAQRANGTSPGAAPQRSQPGVVCLGAVDPVTGAIQTGGVAGRYVEVGPLRSPRDGSEPEAAVGSTAAAGVSVTY